MTQDYSPFAVIGISKAIDALSDLLPGASISSPDNIFSVAQVNRKVTQFVRMENWEAQELGQNIYSKAELFDLMFSDGYPEARLLFLPDDIVGKGEALSYSGTNLREAILNFPHFVFDLDAVFVWPIARQISVFHHGGGFFHVRA